VPKRSLQAHVFNLEFILRLCTFFSFCIFPVEHQPLKAQIIIILFCSMRQCVVALLAHSSS